MDTYRLNANLSFIDVAPPIPGFEKFISVYVLEAGQIALVDVGPSVSVASLVSGLQELGISPEEVSYILVTHIHIDHAGGVGKLLKRLSNARVIVHERGAPHLIDPARLWADTQRALGQQALQYQAIEAVAEDRIVIASDGRLLDLAGTEIEVLATPGHAPHHLSFFDREEGRLFVGDAAGSYTGEVDLIRPATPFPFNLEQSLASLDRLISLNPKSLHYTHFGQASGAIEKLRRFQQQLVLWGRIIADGLEKGVAHQAMYREIRDQDASLAPIDSLPPEQRDREDYFINNSIKGFVGCVRRYGSEYLKQW